ncbi:1-deoxy-D-xylulose-5-phosphate synthase [Actinoplanes sp. NPDC051411]|uniref:1-deoxy-D-xylulose-5-phosphate synthase n=1 Tax=Actinoplanes sp. NPDC051411 TaxID=3155522 RepID=UPI0034391522
MAEEPLRPATPVSVLPRLSDINCPRDLDHLTGPQLDELAAEIREFLVTNVVRTGGHLGPNLGVVELTLAVHRVFDSPRDSILFDVGHQSYVHKLVTGRHDFSGLRRRGGLAGYPQRSESVHDILESSHASSSLSWADGISRAYALTGENDRHVVAVVGDGALTGGLSWEALNNLGTGGERKLVIVVNDNGRSYAPTVGAISRVLAALRSGREVRQPTRIADLDLDYLGPVDGHDLPALEAALRRTRHRDRPVIVHVVTEKGRGYEPARRDAADQFHAIGPVDQLARPSRRTSGGSWTSSFGEAIVGLAAGDRRIIAVTAAMTGATGLRPLADRFPDRVIDVGIAEQHAVASAAGLAFGGLHPVVAMYATFVNRAIDQLLMDVALHRAGVTLVLDRAGVTGPDGATHHGVWDIALLQAVPGLRLAAPRDAPSLREELAEAVRIDDAPTVLRLPKGPVGRNLEAVRRLADGVDVLREAPGRDVLVIAVGPFAAMALEIADRLNAHALGATVVDPRWILPVAPSLAVLATGFRRVVTLEDGITGPGFGARVRSTLLDAGVRTPVSPFGLPDGFLGHGARDDMLTELGLTASQITDEIVRLLASRTVENRETP